MLSSPTPVLATNHVDDPIIIAVDLENGLVTDHDVIIGGYIENEEMPTSVWWHLSNSHEQLAGGFLTSELLEMDVPSSRPRWKFEFTIDAQTAIPCACNLHILAQDSESSPVEAVRAIFFVEGPQPLPPTVSIESPPDVTWASSTLQIEGHSFNIGESVPMIRAKIVQSSVATHCSERDSTEILESVGESGIISSVDSGSGAFSGEIDVSGFEDGLHDIFVFASDDDLAGHSEACISFHIDNTPPVVAISGPDYAIEGSGTLLFDGSETNDAESGRNGLNYIWTVRRPSHTGSLPIEVAAGHDLRTFSVSTDYSGDFEISFTAIDQAGNSNTSIISYSIENLVPIIRLEIDGRAVFDGETVSLTRTSTAGFDATGSSDTANDISSLSCVWKVDNVPIYEGLYREMAWPDGVEDRYILSLEVTDDDRETAILTVIITDAQQSSPTPSSLIILLFSLGFLIFATFKRRRTSDMESQIPKWIGSE